jgi:hypothetical protein
MKPFLFVLIVLLCLTGCQKTAESAALPTLVRFPSLTPTLHPSESPTATLTFTPSPTITATATFTASPSATMSPTAIFSPTATFTFTPSFTATPLPEAFIFGRSAGDRDLLAYRYGTGAKIIMLVGGIHAGFEANTSQLMEELRSHFAINPHLIEEGITILIIPALNPDGAAHGRTLQGRFNGNNVDLNRNWGCGWKEEAFFRDMEVDAGEQAFSEPETRALGSLIQRTLPSAVLFYHAAANGVYAGACDESREVSSDLAALYGQASTYPSGSEFSAYAVTGTAPAWVDSIGIPSLDVELATADTTEFNRNLQAILAVQSWVLAR